MNTHADKLQENKNQSFTNGVSQKQRSEVSTFQFVDNLPEAIAQRKLQEIANNSPQVKQVAQLQAMANNYSAHHQQLLQKKGNDIGLPDSLKSGIENLSGYSMDDVKVHYNSPKPAQLQALAYTQGTDIHVAPGQKEHLPHEAWHIVQQMQGRVKPTMQMKGVQINDDEGLEREADVRGEQARGWAAQPKENPVSKSEVKVRSQIVQKRDRKAEVAWNVTHEVIPDENGSLFGDDSRPFRHEGIELYRGDRIIVDDEDIFQSRRGANQEISERRESDKEGHLTNKWLKLKDVFGRKPSGKGYVREETISIAKDVEDMRKIHSERVDAQSAKTAGDKIYSAWEKLRNNRRMSVGAWERWEKVREDKGKDSSPSWDQIEEGHDVSKELSNSPEEEGGYAEFEEESNQAIFTAYDVESKTPIGIIVIEKRTTVDFPRYKDDNNKKWYLRWLIGHPTLKGAGGLLLNKALDYVKERSGTAVWVESAPSAVGWYQSKGFEPLEEEQQKEYNFEFEKGWDSLLMVLDLK